MRRQGTSEVSGCSDLGLEELAVVAGSIATYLDKAEHLEATDVASVARAASKLRSVAVSIAQAHGLDMLELYASRLGQIERANVLHDPDATGFVAAKAAKVHSLRGLQLLQLEHDRQYHPDVFGRPRDEQLHHFLLHLVKIMSATAAASRDDSLREPFLRTRLPDMFLFGVKIATAVGERLPDESPVRDLWR
jgi:hypothetical protein